MDIDKIAPTNRAIYKPLKDLNLGGRTSALLEEESLGDKEKLLLSDCLAFLVELCSQIRKRFDMSPRSVLARMNCLDAVVALSSNRPKSIAALAAQFPNLVND